MRFTAGKLNQLIARLAKCLTEYEDDLFLSTNDKNFAKKIEKI